MNKKIIKAINFAKKAHKGQLRKNTKSEPYIIHPIMVYNILTLVTSDVNVLCAGILHDVVEDTKTSFGTIKKHFGAKVVNILKQVTKNKDGNFDIKDRNGLVVKLADILHNTSDSTNKKYIHQKIKFLKTFIEDDVEVVVRKSNKFTNNELFDVADYCQDAYMLYKHFDEADNDY